MRIVVGEATNHESLSKGVENAADPPEILNRALSKVVETTLDLLTKGVETLLATQEHPEQEQANKYESLTKGVETLFHERSAAMARQHTSTNP